MKIYESDKSTYKDARKPHGKERKSYIITRQKQFKAQQERSRGQSRGSGCHKAMNETRHSGKPKSQQKYILGEMAK